ncbi:GH3 family domain-containing protein [Alloalcanivorax gelatiniphagus]|uniref:GH3 auxin-responsive promoter family protein n=1 Tax=Alloalcanivorax gelatiniphagus TaxID=1194167 RepID=A0ABY2XMC3_9GAMM|nr:GH3 auxin-responsive promoter family protein [Alloalcanivorax gelatiniphagus]TMW13426.1 GH3 auxin-responsive promoter family protein [Alloalcanivorax gelatiniphagus]
MLGHRLLQAAAAPGHRRFAAGLRQLERVQRQKLAELVGLVAASDSGRRLGVRPDWSWETFRDRLPVTDYEHWRAPIEEARAGQGGALIDSPVVRYQPTSGSTSAIKWIPYSKRFLAELDAAISPWIADLYRAHPRLRRGGHYWSMSWMPTELRDSMREDVNDDLQLMSLGKRLLAGATQSVPQTVSLARSSDDSLFATLAYLVADRSLSLLSVWSPTFGLGLLDALATWREELARALRAGDWGPRSAAMAGQRCPRSARGAALLSAWDGQDPEFFTRLWPGLAVVSAWDTSASAPWARRLSERLPQAAFQGKGLWATEGVVTFPYRDHHLLAYRSHVYEFQDPEDDRVYAPWELRTGQRVMPLMSTGAGLLRYRLNDLVRVEGHLGQVPALSFLGRLGSTDLVGEKLTGQAVHRALEAVPVPAGLAPVSVVALDDSGDGRPGYVLLLDGDGDGSPAELGGILEQALQANFHYQLARNLQQLAPVRCLARPGMRDLYLEQCRRRGMIEGNIKMETLQHWRGELPASLRAPAAGVEALS